MAHTFAYTSASSFRLNSLVSVPNSSSSPESHKLFLPVLPFHSRKLGKIVGGRRNLRNSLVKAIYSGEFSSLGRNCRQGIWSIRDDAYAQGQGPPPMVQERFQSVIGQLFQYRIIRCGGAVDDDMANIIVAQLLYLDAVNPNKDIVMYVNSPGGSVTAGMAIFDTMMHIRPDVSTVCVGLAASMGAFLLSAGTKGKRYSLPNSRIMIHQPLGGAQGGQSDIDIQANEVLHHKANLNGYLSYHTGQSLDKINQDTDRDFFMSAQEAKEYGLIDGVIMNPLKAFKPSAAASATKDLPGSTD
ncbi:ATP-dependent Clp protease proteolytic subunit 5, chloroplastic-like [Cucurbita maxima]|uniref:ATP-dependent Clp protease proteolytic subunit n=1 Tax=Cucurbita maxima TaxID=3661 RepID=A0A6J1J646_CUCMA|nr:ATP-dependent Clp protease proteolytic subunit 5, chloroplastic-like [Cucurbita maxima]